MYFLEKLLTSLVDGPTWELLKPLSLVLGVQISELTDLLISDCFNFFDAFYTVPLCFSLDWQSLADQFFNTMYTNLGIILEISKDPLRSLIPFYPVNPEPLAERGLHWSHLLEIRNIYMTDTEFLRQITDYQEYTEALEEMQEIDDGEVMDYPQGGDPGGEEAVDFRREADVRVALAGLSQRWDPSETYYLIAEASAILDAADLMEAEDLERSIANERQNSINWWGNVLIKSLPLVVVVIASSVRFFG